MDRRQKYRRHLILAPNARFPSVHPKVDREMSTVAKGMNGGSNQSLRYVGLIFVADELVKNLIINPIRAFYAGASFGSEMPFISYEEDVLPRHSHEFDACLLYMRDFVQVLDSKDVLALQALRKHRKQLARDLIGGLRKLEIDRHVGTLTAVNAALYKLRSDRSLGGNALVSLTQHRSIDWISRAGTEQRIFDDVVREIVSLGTQA
jgi:hypothetical protein